MGLDNSSLFNDLGLRGGCLRAVCTTCAVCKDQAMGHAHRIGQQRPVTVYRLVTAGSIDERIVALQRDKRSLADGILEGQDNAGPIGAETLRELLRDA